MCKCLSTLLSTDHVKVLNIFDNIKDNSIVFTRVNMIPFYQTTKAVNT